MGLLNSIEKLGFELEANFRRANADQRALPGIAEAALVQFSDLDGVEIATLADFLQETRLPQQARNPFSDLPLTLFRSRDFYIELLVWSNATTAIHQHGFSGAFRVVRGSSIHTRYAFSTQRRISDDCLLGDVTAQGSEALSVGSVRRIAPGADGLIHSLYHLDNPSLSLIIRTSGHPAFGPQYSYFPPSLALYRKALESDEMVLMFSRLLAISHSTNRALFQSIWLEKIAAMEFPRVAWMYLRHHALLENDERTAFIECVETKHGELAGHLYEAVQRYENQRRLIGLREQIHDAELRFFVALLLNVPDRKDLLGMVAERLPDRDPAECCADWLTHLSVDEQSALHRMKEVAKMMESSAKDAIAFSRQLRRALPVGTDVAGAREIFRRFIDKNAGVAPERSIDSLPEGVSDALQTLDQIPQLSGLRSRSSGSSTISKESLR